MVELNFVPPGGKQPPLTIFETNPNNYTCGWAELEQTVKDVFGEENLPDLKNTRMDLNAETTSAGVQYFKNALRLPGKRSDGKEGKVQDDTLDWYRGGLETIRFGKYPSQLQIYDKIRELKFRKVDYVERLPKTLTRLEFRLQGKKCPVERFIDIPEQLNNCRPFTAIQLKECAEHYDYKEDLDDSLRRRLFNALREDVGCQEAIKYLNKTRHFGRDFKALVYNNEALKAEIEQNYFRSNRRFLSGRGASIQHQYCFCGWCNLLGTAEQLRDCGGCGARLCFECIDLDNKGHEADCPLRKESHN
jgi:hypothetical protein